MISLDEILDKFSKAHPFADTRAYNVFHDQAKTALQEYFLQLIPEKKAITNASQTPLEQLGMSIDEATGYNQAIEELRGKLI